MYLVSKESNRECRRSSDLKKLTYTTGRRQTPDKSVSDKLRLTKVSGANYIMPVIIMMMMMMDDDGLDHRK